MWLLFSIEVLPAIHVAYMVWAMQCAIVGYDGAVTVFDTPKFGFNIIMTCHKHEFA
jgi:hypothetical protein